MNSKQRKYCIVGTSGFARETFVCLIDALEAKGNRVDDNVVFMESDDQYREAEVMDVPVIKQSDFVADDYQVVVAIGDPQRRKHVVTSLPSNTHYTSIVHPSAVLSRWVTLGEGSIVTAGTIVTCNIKIGRHAHLNLHTTVGHDCEIGDFFTTAPGANISGNCHFGECVYFGTNASVRQGISICDHVTIGMGGVVVKDIGEAGVYVGNPLRPLNR